MKISSIKGLINDLNGVAKHINISQGGGTWASVERDTNVRGVWGILEKNFTENLEDPAIHQWSMELETILNQSTTEQSSFDFKIGFCNTGRKEFVDKTFSKAIKTLTAMANRGKDQVGYLIVGVADKEKDAKDIEAITGEKSLIVGRHYITGVNHDIKMLNIDDDRYFQKIIQKLEKEPIDSKYISKIASSIRFLNYGGKNVIIMKLEKCNEAILYNKKYYERRGANNHEIEMENIASFLKKFL